MSLLACSALVMPHFQVFELQTSIANVLVRMERGKRWASCLSPGRSRGGGRDERTGTFDMMPSAPR